MGIQDRTALYTLTVVETKEGVTLTETQPTTDQGQALEFATSHARLAGLTVTSVTAEPLSVAIEIARQKEQDHA